MTEVEKEIERRLLQADISRTMEALHDGIIRLDDQLSDLKDNFEFLRELLTSKK